MNVTRLLPLLAATAPLTPAADLYWNPGGTNGDGIWGSSPGDKNWNPTAGAPTGNIPWPDSGAEIANFNDNLGGIVTVFDSLKAAGLVQEGSDYTINAGTIVLVSSAITGSPTIHITEQPGRLTIDSTLSGDAGMIKDGLGTLVLTGDNLYSGTTAIEAGTLDLLGTLTSNQLTISSDADLINSSAGLPSGTILSNSGTVTINNLPESIDIYQSFGGELANGSAPLITNSSEFNVNSLMAGQMTTNTLTSRGELTLSGSATADQALISSGTLILSGSLTSPSVEITGRAQLRNQSGGLDDTTALSNEGSLTMEADDRVASYLSNGGTLTNGQGTLFTDTAELRSSSLIFGKLATGSLDIYDSATIRGRITADSGILHTGQLILSGELISTAIEIVASARLRNTSGGLGDAMILTNAGTLILDSPDTISSYSSVGGSLRGQTLTTTTAELRDGSQIDGSLLTTTLYNRSGINTITGSVVSSSSFIEDGTLELRGQLSSPSVKIGPAGTLANYTGGLDDTTMITNQGRLTTGAEETIASYVSHGGTLTDLAGNFLLTSQVAQLNDASRIHGRLLADDITTRGSVLVSGSLSGERIQIATGVLENTGQLGGPNSQIDIHAGAILVAGGSQNYARLTTSGSGAGIWQGDLFNPTNIAPGGSASPGTLQVLGDFTNGSAGSLEFEVSNAASDLITVSGNAHFGGTLDVKQLGPLSISPFVPITLVDAASYSGNISTLREDLPGAVWFNPGNGQITSLGAPGSSNRLLSDTTPNQGSAWLALYDDVIDPGVDNVIVSPAGVEITSGIADASEPDLMWALAASFTPGGLDRQLLNHLSPAPYAGLADYAVQANRSHQRSALTAPALAARPTSVHADAKSGAKDAISASQAPAWELFAATDYFTVDSGSSVNASDYTLSGWGFLAGARIAPREGLKIAAYLALDEGSVQGSLIDADSTGWSIGLIGDLLIDEGSQTRLTAGMSYGSYGFDGRRTSASATNAGWAPGLVGFSGVDSDALEIFASIECMLYQTERFRLIPSVGLRFTTGSVDSFSEFTAPGPGSPIPLQVGSNNHQSGLAEFSLLAEADITSQLLVQGNIGINASLGDDGYTLNARYAAGGSPIYAGVDGLSSNSVFLGLGAVYQVNQDLSAGIFYRAEFRDEAHTQQGFSLSSSLRF